MPISIFLTVAGAPELVNKIRMLCQLSLADFRERTRRSSFTITLLGVLFLGYLVITGKYTIQFGPYRTPYDSVWVGTLMAVCSTILLTILGFYFVRGSIKRDRQTEVGQIIAATPLSNSTYILSKFASNVVVLWSMTAMLAVMAFLTLIVRNEAGGINLAAFALPFLLISLPAMAFVAAAAVLFDTVRMLRGSIGNAVYLFLAEFCLVMGMLEFRLIDIGGVSLFAGSVETAASAAFPGENIPLMAGFAMFDTEFQYEVYKTFSWEGIRWSAEVISSRLIWVASGCAVAGFAVAFFDRFDSAGAGRVRGRKKMKADMQAERDEPRHARSGLTYGKLRTPEAGFNVIPMAVEELRLACKGYHWFWYAAAAGLLAAQLAAPFEIVRQYIAPLAMVWPLAIWSSMGTREFRYGTSQLMFSSPGPVTRQLPATWISGLAVSMVAISGALSRSFTSDCLSYGAALLVGALLVPSAALALGSVSHSRRPFEIGYLMIWYIGSIEHLPAIDLLGTTEEAIAPGKFVLLLILSLFFVSVAFVTRRIRLQTA